MPHVSQRYVTTEFHLLFVSQFIDFFNLYEPYVFLMPFKTSYWFRFVEYSVHNLFLWFHLISFCKVGGLASYAIISEKIAFWLLLMRV